MRSIRRALPLGLLLGLALICPGAASAVQPDGAHAKAPTAKAAQGEDDEVVLPTRVAAPIRRAQRSLDNAEEHIDENEFTQAVTSLRSVRRNMYRADKAAQRQMNAPAPPEGEEGGEESATTGPDSVIAVLNLDSTIATTVAGLFDTNSKGVVDALTHAMFRTLNARDRLLDTVIALDPEGAGADYADGMADTITGYDDEVANLSEAVQDDQLSPGGQKVLTKALAQVQATQAKVNTAFGGGE
jgi:hypothetical protein